VSVVVDAGPLIAIINSNDADHTRCVRALSTASRPLIIPITVLAEVCHIVEREMGPQGEADFLESLDNGTFGLAPVTFEDTPHG
jgi:uncharacterized protein